MTLCARLLDAARRVGPDAVALCEGGETLGYGDLLRCADTLCGMLRDRGAKAEDVVAVQMPNSMGGVLAVIGALRLGARCLLLDTGLKSGETAAHLERIGASLLLTAAGRDAPDAAPAALSVPEVPAMLRAARPLDAVLADTAATPAGGGFLLLSSGTTGRPKALLRTEAQALSALTIFGKTLPGAAGDRVLGVLPLFHSFGLLYVLLSTLTSGARLYLAPFSPRATVREVEGAGITIFPGTPFMFRLLAETRFKRRPDFSRLRTAISAGSALPPAVARRFHEVFGQPILQSYGTTETGPVAIGRLDREGHVPGSVGRPYAGVEIVFPQAAVPAVSAETSSGIAVRSPANATGYLDMPEATAQVFADDLVITGDVGYLASSGELVVLGRERPMLNVAGKKVSPAEVEACLRSHPAVAEVLVTGTRTAGGDDRIKATVAASAEVDAMALREYCASKLAEFKAPREIVFVKNLSEGAMGKVRIAGSG